MLNEQSKLPPPHWLTGRQLGGTSTAHPALAARRPPVERAVGKGAQKLTDHTIRCYMER